MGHEGKSFRLNLQVSKRNPSDLAIADQSKVGGNKNDVVLPSTNSSEKNLNSVINTITELPNGEKYKHILQDTNSDDTLSNHEEGIPDCEIDIDRDLVLDTIQLKNVDFSFKSIAVQDEEECESVSSTSSPSSNVPNLQTTNHTAEGTTTTITSSTTPATAVNIPTAAALPVVNLPIPSLRSISTILTQPPPTVEINNANIGSNPDPIPTVHVGAAYAEIQPSTQDIPQVTLNSTFQPQTVNSTLFGNAVLSSASEISLSIIVLVIIAAIF
ncbi:hypothetical protein HDV06_000466 [Boothiomyces sp. JEL0866]|nr:hypothetical protein HDV06_000466 [Boothiomyces sp. JEL0866]